MKNILTTIMLLAVSTALVAQNNPINFEADGNGADWTWRVFENSDDPALEIIDNPDATGANTSAKVAKFTARVDGQSFAGFTSDGIGTFTLDETNRTIKIMVWKSVISDVGIKLEAAGGWSEGEIKVANTLTDQWEELTFDFSDKNNPPAEEGGEFAVITIFPDFNARSAETITYLDNVIFGEGGQGGGGGGGGGNEVTTPTPPYAVGDTLVANGSFEAFALGAATNSLNWAFNTTAEGATGSATIVDASQDSDGKALQVTIASFAGASDWNVEAVNEPINVVEGESYEAKVWLKADTDTRIARTYIGLPASGNWARFEETDVTLTTEWAEYSFMRTATADDEANTMRYGIAMNLAANDGATIWIDNMTVVKVESTNNEILEVPSGFTLQQNYPNPFNPSTNISYSLPVTGEVTLEVFNLQGQKVATLFDGVQSAGAHTAAFDATSLASGVYVYRLVAGSNIQIKKMMLIK